MPIRSKFELLRSNSVFVGGSDQCGSKISGVMRIGHAPRRSCPELTQERAKPSSYTDEIMRCKRENRMLSRALWQSGKLRREMRNPFRRLFGNGDAYLARVIKHDSVSVDYLKRGHWRIAFYAANGLLTDPVDVGVRIECTAIRATR